MAKATPHVENYPKWEQGPTLLDSSLNKGQHSNRRLWAAADYYRPTSVRLYVSLSVHCIYIIRDNNNNAQSLFVRNDILAVNP